MAIIYNVTIKVDWSIHDAWVSWMKETHIPEVLATGCFHKHQFVRVLEIDDAEGPTYAAQYYTTDLDTYERYLVEFAPQLRNAGFDLWGNKFIAFRSLMQIVN
jgi:hypothetical protein